MPINYTLVDNPLTERPDDFRAITTTEIIVDEKFLVEFLAQRGNTTTTHYLAVMNEIDEALKYFIEQGYGINLPFININYSISGVFENATDTYDANRHKINILVHLGKELRKINTANIPLVKQTTPHNQSLITQVLDIASQKTDSILTSGNMLQILGNLIKIDGTDAGNGVFFINQSTQAEVKAQFIANNTPKSLTLLIPALPAGEYKVKVVTQYSGGGNTIKLPKSILFDKILTVS